MQWCPAPLGIQEDGREVLTFIEGEVPQYPMPDWVWTVDNLVRAGRLLKQLHDLTTGYVDGAGTWQQEVREPVEVVCHNDFAPYNMVFREGELVGVIDFDMASPGPRIWDFAYLAYRLVPLTSPDNPDGIPNHGERQTRLRALMRSYDARFSTEDVVEGVTRRLRHLAEFSDAMAAERDEPKLHEHADLYRADAHYLRRTWAVR